MTIGRISIIVLALWSAVIGSPIRAAAAAPPLPSLFIIGDSTVNNHTQGLLGWGDPIAGYFDKTKINVENRARGRPQQPDVSDRRAVGPSAGRHEAREEKTWR